MNKKEYQEYNHKLLHNSRMYYLVHLSQFDRSSAIVYSMGGVMTEEEFAVVQREFPQKAKDMKGATISIGVHGVIMN